LKKITEAMPVMPAASLRTPAPDHAGRCAAIHRRPGQG
jgi:hypothetical protein